MLSVDLGEQKKMKRLNRERSYPIVNMVDDSDNPREEEECQSPDLFSDEDSIDYATSSDESDSDVSESMLGKRARYSDSPDSYSHHRHDHIDDVETRPSSSALTPEENIRHCEIEKNIYSNAPTVAVDSKFLPFIEFIAENVSGLNDRVACVYGSQVGHKLGEAAGYLVPSSCIKVAFRLNRQHTSGSFADSVAADLDGKTMIVGTRWREKYNVVATPIAAFHTVVVSFTPIADDDSYKIRVHLLLLESVADREKAWEFVGRLVRRQELSMDRNVIALERPSSNEPLPRAGKLIRLGGPGRRVRQEFETLEAQLPLEDLGPSVKEKEIPVASLREIALHKLLFRSGPSLPMDWHPNDYCFL